MNTFTVHLAGSGQCQQVVAQDCRSALKAVGRRDACLVEPQDDGAIDVTFDPAALTIITARFNGGNAAERLAFALATLVNHLDSQTLNTPRTVQNGGWISASDLISDDRRRRKALRRIGREGDDDV